MGYPINEKVQIILSDQSINTVKELTTGMGAVLDAEGECLFQFLYLNVIQGEKDKDIQNL